MSLTNDLWTDLLSVEAQLSFLTKTPFDCLTWKKTLIASNLLNFNDLFLLFNDKTEINFVSSASHSTSPADLISLEPFVKFHVKRFRLMIDSNFNLEKQICSVVKRSFFKQRFLSKVKLFLYFNGFEWGIHDYYFPTRVLKHFARWCKPGQPFMTVAGPECCNSSFY